VSGLQALGLVPLAPLLGFVVLLLGARHLPDRVVAVIASTAIGVAALCAFIAGRAFLAGDAATATLTLWSWLAVDGFAPAVRLHLDGLSLVMTGVITGVGFLIHVYATGYMRGEAGYARFFAVMNLFVFAMLLLVLADDLLLLYLGWEGVGLCSFLLIGFYHEEPANGYAARKAFVITRIGDTAMALGLFLLFRELGTLRIAPMLDAATLAWPEGSPMATLACLLLLGGAVGKSAQLPLQTWLPDAMAGPTPVSALIHAATMVTAGVYLIARTHPLYLLAPDAQFAVALVGLATLFIAAFSALVQTDLKRILAYSTMSQIGYMFLALGVGAWSAAIFHLMTHAFFKALLFLSAGSVILSLHHEQDVRRMGGLWRRLPIPFLCMLVGSAALAALPLTSGYFSKDLILLAAWEQGDAGPLLWGGALLAALVTAIYSTRMMWLVFFGPLRTEPHGQDGLDMSLPLGVLALASLGGGWFGFAVVADVLPDQGIGHGADHDALIAGVTAAVPILGVVGALWWYRSRAGVGVDSADAASAESAPARFLRGGWGFDALYATLLERPFVLAARANRRDLVDLPFALTAATARVLHRTLSATQTGSLRWYATSMAIGLLAAFALALGLR
jgi:NADH-quinone oxidoreductase subunit L